MGVSEVTLVDVVDAGRSRQVRLMRVCGVLVAVVFLAAIAGLGAVSPAHSWTPAQQLARVHQFVAAARTARFTGVSTWSSGSPTGQLGSHFEHTSRSVGVLSLPDRSHWTEDYGDGALETIVAPDAVFEREADTVTALTGEQWKQYPHTANELPLAPQPDPSGDTGAGPGIHAVVGQASGVVRALGAPADVTEVLDHLTNLTRVSERVIRGTFDMASLPNLPADAGPLPTVTVELGSDTSGRLESLVATAIGKASDGNSPEESFTSHTDLHFTQWGAPVDISVPSADRVDKTPDVDEESLATFSAAPILVPGNLPNNYQLTSASASGADNGDCAEADLTYGDPSKEAADPDAASASEINVTITPAACDGSPMEGDPITVAGHPAHITHGDVTNDDYAVTIDTVIGTARMTVDSDLPAAQVLAALQSIVPFNLATQHIATAPPVGVTS